jgi:DNA cross-link repair 1A protein
MSRNKENEAWKEATEAEKSKWGQLKGKGKVKKFVKKEKDEEEIHDHSEAEKENTKQDGSNQARRAAPFYKVLQGMPIAVDAFRYGKVPGVTAYFLT